MHSCLRFGIEAKEEVLVAVEPEPPAPLSPWEDEPTTLDMLQDTYIVEAKMSGRDPGTTLFLTVSKKRDGTCVGVQEGQRFKLFLAARPQNFCWSSESFRLPTRPWRSGHRISSSRTGRASSSRLTAWRS